MPVTATNPPAFGALVAWLTMFGEWRFGAFVRIDGEFAEVKAINGLVLVPLAELR